MKRWPIIRHVRALLLAWRAERYYRNWQKVSNSTWKEGRKEALNDFGIAAERDYQQARRIWRGEDI